MRVDVPTNFAPAGAVTEPITVLQLEQRIPAKVRIVWPGGRVEWAPCYIKATCAKAALVRVTPGDGLTRENWFLRADVAPEPRRTSPI